MMDAKKQKDQKPPATSVSTGRGRAGFAGIYDGPWEVGMCFVVSEGGTHLGQVDLGAIIRPAER